MAALSLAAIMAHLWIERILNLRVCEPISNADAFHRNVHTFVLLVGLPNAVGDGRDIVASIGLPKDIEVGVAVLLELREEALEEREHIVGHARFIVCTKSAGESDARGLVYPHHIGLAVPAELVGYC